MQHLIAMVIGWTLAVVAAVGLVAGAPQAAHVAGNAMSTIGITAGALVGGASSLIKGFQNARLAGRQNARNAQFGPPRPGPRFRPGIAQPRRPGPAFRPAPRPVQR